MFSKQLNVYELYAETFTRDHMLMAPSPNYSILSTEKLHGSPGKICIDMKKLIGFPSPSKYRGAIVITHSQSSRVIAKVSTRQNARELFPNKAYANHPLV